MPECKDIVNQLKAVLPYYTDKFHDTATLTSFSRVGSTITFQTNATTLSTNDRILIKDVLMANEATITIVGNIATCTTVSYHDMTENFGQKAIFTGIAESGWDVSFDILTVPTQNTFTFEVPTGIATPTRTFYLLENRASFNGFQTITKISTGVYSFVLDTDEPDLLPASGNVEHASLIYNQRIAGASMEANILKFYGDYPQQKEWLWVVLGGITASKSRDNDSDATAKIKPSGEDYTQELLLPFDIYVILPQQDDDAISGRISRDLIESDIRKAIFKSLLGVNFDSGFVNKNQYCVVFVSDEPVSFLGSAYEHRFSFELPFTITNDIDNAENGDIVKPSESSAFRSFEINYQNDFDETVKSDEGEIV